MPQAINLTIKDGANVDTLFELLTPSAGDGGIAEWVHRDGSISSVFPVISASARKTGNKSRQLRVKVRLPSSYTDAVTGQTVVASGAEFNGTFSVPNDFPEALKDDWVAFACNTINHALFKAMIKDAVPAT